MKRFAFSLLLGILFALPAWAKIHPTLPAPGTLDGVGVNIHFTDPQPGELEMMRAAGIHWVRMDFSWAATEPEIGKFDFSRYDHLVAALEEQGMHAYFILDYGHPHFADPGDKQPFTSRAGTAEFREAYARWAVAAVSHFKGRGIVWELWNEPNIPNFWQPKPNAADYLALAKAAAAALHAAGLRGDPKSPEYFNAPGECLVGPTSSEVDLSFLETCFAGGLLDFVDAVSVHPYRQTAPETASEDFRAVRLLIRRYCAQDTMPFGSFDPERPHPRREIPILAGEWGYSTAWNNFSDDFQATYLPRMFLTNITNQIPITIWYDWRDDGDKPKDGEHRFGIVRRPPTGDPKQPFEPKPAYTALRTMCEELKGMHVAQAEQAHTSLLLFANQEQEKLVCWSLTPKADVLYRTPVLANEWRAKNSDGTPGTPAIVKDHELEPQPQANVRYWQPTARDAFQQLRAGWDRLPLEVMLKVPKAIDRELKLKNETALDWKLATQVDGTGGFSRQGSDLPKPLPIESFSTGETTSLNMIFAGAYGSLECGDSLFARYEATAKGQPGLSFSQSCPMVPLNPVAYRVLPSPGKELVVGITSSFDTPTTGAWFDAPLSRLPEKELFQKLQFPARVGDHTETVFKVPYVRENHTEANREILALLALDIGPVGQAPGALLSFHAPLPQIIDGFISTALAVHPDGDAKIISEQSLADAQPADGPSASGTPSVRLSYRFAAGWKFVRVAPKGAALQKIEGAPARYGLWIHGDGQGGIPCIRFRDALGQVFQVRGEPITWKGWKYVTWPLRPEAESAPGKAQPAEQRVIWAHWGGAEKDGNKADGGIHYPIEWDTLFLLDGGKREMIGELYLSAPSLIYP